MRRVVRNFARAIDRVVVAQPDSDGIVAGTVSSVATGLDVPASAVLRGDQLLVTLTQFDSLFMPDAAGPPELPFCVGSARP
uniref:hypothetical protein n=1 Tax=Sandaracinus sp. TaxID=2024858 RepID=UPI0019D45E1D|nr:hypothetical protein [Sandaracinus sp.]